MSSYLMFEIVFKKGLPKLPVAYELVLLEAEIVTGSGTTGAITPVPPRLNELRTDYL